MLDKLFSHLKGVNVTISSWFLGVSGVVLVRFFLESLSSPTPIPGFASDLSTIIHYFLFFLSFAVFFMIYVHFTFPRFRSVAPQFVAVAMGAIFIAPIFDWLVTGGKGLVMAYLFDTPKQMLYSFWTFFGPNINYGITLGIRAEVAIILITIFSLVILETKKFWKALFAAVLIYTSIFLFVSMPGIISLFGEGESVPLSFFQNSISSSHTLINHIPTHFISKYDNAILNIGFNFAMAKIFFILTIFLGSIYFLISNKSKFVAVLKNSRPERISHYIFMFLIGVLAAYTLYPIKTFNWIDWLSVIVAILSIYFSWMFAVCINDFEDVDIDEVTNINRPLITSSLEKRDMGQISSLFLVFCLIGAYLNGSNFMFLIISFTALYYIYSVSITRYKLIPFFSSFLIGLCCLSVVMSGFYLVSPNKDFAVFPDRLAFAIVLIFFLWSNIRDMKDIEGDKKAGVKTLPIIFGDFWGPKVVGFLAGFAYILIPIISGMASLVATSLLASIATYYFVNRKPYKEKFVIIVYILYVVLSIVLILT